MPLRQQDILSGKDTKLLRVELNKQNKKKHTCIIPLRGMTQMCLSC